MAEIAVCPSREEGRGAEAARPPGLPGLSHCGGGAACSGQGSWEGRYPEPCKDTKPLLPSPLPALGPSPARPSGVRRPGDPGCVYV